MKGLIKAQWHKEMKPIALKLASGICKKCEIQTSLRTGVIHHTSYPAGVYEVEVKELIDNGICIWLCHSCHEKVHMAKSYDETRIGVKNAGMCSYCGQVAFGGWNRAQHLDPNKCLCKKCFKSIKKGKYFSDKGQKSLF